MGVEVSSLGVDVFDSYDGANSDVYIKLESTTRRNIKTRRTSICISHTTTTKGMLEFRAHKAIAIARVRQDSEMDPEHEHIEQRRDYDQTHSPRHKVAHKQPNRYSRITQQ